jgi:hypothetical protein
VKKLCPSELEVVTDVSNPLDCADIFLRDLGILPTPNRRTEVLSA